MLRLIYRPDREPTECDNCGAVLPLWKMKDYNVGRRTIYLCPECAIHGDRDVYDRQRMKGSQYRKERK